MNGGVLLGGILIKYNRDQTDPGISGMRVLMYMYM